MSGKYIFGKGVNIGVMGTLAGGSVAVGDGAVAADTGRPSLSKTTLKDGDTIVIGDATIEGPCVVEVRDGRVWVDGKARPTPAPIQVTVTLKSKPDKDIQVTGGTVVVEEGMGKGSLTTTGGSVTVHGPVASLTTTGGSVQINGTVTTMRSTGGSVRADKIDKVAGSVVYL